MVIWDPWSYDLYIYRVLFVSGHFSSVWGHSVHFAKFPMFCRFSKGYSSHIFIQFQPNFMESMVIRGEIQLLLFGHLPKIKKILHLKMILNKGPFWGQKLQKPTPSTVFIQSQANCIGHSGYYGGIQAITFLGNWPSFKHFVAL